MKFLDNGKRNIVWEKYKRMDTDFTNVLGYINNPRYPGVGSSWCIYRSRYFRHVVIGSSYYNIPEAFESVPEMELIVQAYECE